MEPVQIDEEDKALWKRLQIFETFCETISHSSLKLVIESNGYDTADVIMAVNALIEGVNYPEDLNFWEQMCKKYDLDPEEKHTLVYAGMGEKSGYTLIKRGPKKEIRAVPVKAADIL